jgi:hypothetical protein
LDNTAASNALKIRLRCRTFVFWDRGRDRPRFRSHWIFCCFPTIVTLRLNVSPNTFVSSTFLDDLAAASGLNRQLFSLTQWTADGLDNSTTFVRLELPSVGEWLLIEDELSQPSSAIVQNFLVDVDGFGLYSGGNCPPWQMEHANSPCFPVAGRISEAHLALTGGMVPENTVCSFACDIGWKNEASGAQTMRLICQEGDWHMGAFCCFVVFVLFWFFSSFLRALLLHSCFGHCLFLENFNQPQCVKVLRKVIASCRIFFLVVGSFVLLFNNHPPSQQHKNRSGSIGSFSICISCLGKYQPNDCQFNSFVYRRFSGLWALLDALQQHVHPPVVAHFFICFTKIDKLVKRFCFLKAPFFAGSFVAVFV